MVSRKILRITIPEVINLRHTKKLQENQKWAHTHLLGRLVKAKMVEDIFKRIGSQKRAALHARTVKSHQFSPATPTGSIHEELNTGQDGNFGNCCGNHLPYIVRAAAQEQTIVIPDVSRRWTKQKQGHTNLSHQCSSTIYKPPQLDGIIKTISTLIQPTSKL